MRLRAIPILCSVLAACAAGTAAAQAYPDRTVTLVNPFPPGGVVDNQGRPLAAALERALKQPVVILNKPGGAGAVGYTFAANAKPDGYTVLAGIVSVSSIPEADKLFGRAPSYSLDQLVPVARVSADPIYVAVLADSPWKTLKEMLDAIKAKPMGYSYSSSGPYGALHVPTEMLLQGAGAKARHVPTTGGGPAINALLGGHVDFTTGGPSALAGQMKAGKFRVLAGTGAKRHPVLPDVPTMTELGYDMDYYLWLGLFVPRGTPEAAVKVLRDATRAAVNDPEFRGAMGKMNAIVDYQDQPEFKKFWDADAARIATAVKG
ncbi:MAG: tripartite tricarboxylate transporter substrate binding protein, partial [Burkholderiales bacterium]